MPLVATVTIVVLLASQAIGERVYGASRIPAAVSAQLARLGTANIAVQLRFTPESFNLTYLSKEGNTVQTKGATIYMSGVSSGSVTAIAGQYWVRSVRSWSGG